MLWHLRIFVVQHSCMKFYMEMCFEDGEQMKKIWKKMNWVFYTILASAIFAMGFSLFLEPNGINTGGISGLAMIANKLTGVGTVGIFSIAMNIPLFLLGGVKIGKRFFAGSLLGMVVSSVLIDEFSLIYLPVPDLVVAALYGGVLCGIGLGIVFVTGTSTGGSDIFVRLMQLRNRNVQIGQISIMFDVTVVVLTGIAFWDVTKTLYSGIVAFVSGQIVDAVVYRFDYSKVALIVTTEHEAIARIIDERLDRGATYLHGAGSYTKQEMEIVLTVVKKRQLAELKEIVMSIDEKAFVIVQEAHQVLGDGFTDYFRAQLQ